MLHESFDAEEADEKGKIVSITARRREAKDEVHRRPRRAARCVPGLRRGAAGQPGRPLPHHRSSGSRIVARGPGVQAAGRGGRFLLPTLTAPLGEPRQAWSLSSPPSLNVTRARRTAEIELVASS
jgi:hypothetical protein